MPTMIGSWSTKTKMRNRISKVILVLWLLVFTLMCVVSLVLALRLRDIHNYVVNLPVNEIIENQKILKTEVDNLNQEIKKQQTPEDGKDGIGIKGDKGEKGDRGPRGKTGKTGADGKDGVDGEDGEDARQIEICLLPNLSIGWRYVGTWSCSAPRGSQ